MGFERLSTYEIGNLNEHKQITARFSEYKFSRAATGEWWIHPVLVSGDLPEWGEGHKTNGQQLLISLCNLYLMVKDKNDAVASDLIMKWCIENGNPYYLHESILRPYDWKLRENADVWDGLINLADCFSFEFDQMMADLKSLHEYMEILLLFRDVREGVKIDDVLLNTTKLQEYKSLTELSEMEQLEQMDSILAGFPEFPLRLSLDELGDFRIIHNFTSVFDAAYFALARFVATGYDVPLREYGKTPLQVCSACGKIYYKSGNRQNTVKIWSARGNGIGAKPIGMRPKREENNN